ncbi:hypothetical protein Hypma_013284 [Hypsizygus marmoreus]|uniref:Uncharacterized protein n=1 Tax=Hypsizygus marmoreus TaxID=39966 RepID=A0A369JC18_HYPMA|nr:hypothetical protein Hypma_013284 [Hypsizygus marmoreus]
MRTRFYGTVAKPSSALQGLRKRNRPRLSAEAREALNARRRHAAESYKKALSEAWTKIDEATEDLAAAHHKTVRRVQSELHMGRQLSRIQRKKTNAWNAFCWKKSQDKENGPELSARNGKEVLQNLVQNHQDEYNALTTEERKVLIREFDEHKATKATGRRISVKAKINDVTQTLAAVENELNNLKSRTGVETMLFTTRGTTDMPMNGIAFATEGVENFLEGTLKTDTQDFLGKMEGFAVAGVKGAAKNHQQRVSALRGEIRQEINEKLRAVTGDPSARMEWKHYWRNVVKRYHVIIEDWPTTIPFRNLSEASSSLTELESLLRKWNCDKVYWKTLTESELAALDSTRDRRIEDGEIEAPAPRRRRSDFGKKRTRSKGGADNGRPPKSRRNISSETVHSDDDEPNPHNNDDPNSESRGPGACNTDPSPSGGSASNAGTASPSGSTSVDDGMTADTQLARSGDAAGTELTIGGCAN